MNIHEVDTRFLLRSYEQIMDELMRRKIVRSARNPIAEYTHWCVVNALGLTSDSVDSDGGVDNVGQRYFIRGRRLSRKVKDSYQVAGLKHLRKRTFDQLVVVIFDDRFEVREAWLIPYELVLRYASFNAKSQTYSLVLRGPLLRHPRVVSVKALF